MQMRQTETRIAQCAEMVYNGRKYMLLEMEFACVERGTM